MRKCPHSSKYSKKLYLTWSDGLLPHIEFLSSKQNRVPKIDHKCRSRMLVLHKQTGLYNQK